MLSQHSAELSNYVLRKNGDKKMKQFKHLGSYGLIVRNHKIVLIKKKGGPYDGKLDLPGGTIEWGETPEETLVRELKEEVGIDVKNFYLFDANSSTFEWIHHDELENGHHIGVFYVIEDYESEILSDINIDSHNDDSMGAKFYSIKELNKKNLSNIAVLEIEKLGYELED